MLMLCILLINYLKYVWPVYVKTNQVNYWASRQDCKVKNRKRNSAHNSSEIRSSCILKVYSGWDWLCSLSTIATSSTTCSGTPR